MHIGAYIGMHIGVHTSACTMHIGMHIGFRIGMHIGMHNNLEHDRVCFPASFVTLVRGCMLATSRTTVALATIFPGPRKFFHSHRI